MRKDCLCTKNGSVVQENGATEGAMWERGQKKWLLWRKQHFIAGAKNQYFFSPHFTGTEEGNMLEVWRIGRNLVSQVCNNNKTGRQSCVMELCLSWWEQGTWSWWHWYLWVFFGLQVKEHHFFFVTHCSEIKITFRLYFSLLWCSSACEVQQQCRWIGILLPFSTREQFSDCPVALQKLFSPARQAHRTTSLLGLTCSSNLPFLWGISFGAVRSGFCWTSRPS